MYQTPLSTSPEEFSPPTAWYGSLLGWAMGLTFLAIFVERKVELPLGTLVFLAALLALEQLAEQVLRRSLAKVG